MLYVQDNETIVQIHPQVGEVWALHRNVRKRENPQNSESRGKPWVWLVVLSFECGRGQPSEICVLRK